MKKQEIKLVMFAATISVLIISLGNMPVATAVVIPPGTLTVIQFCNIVLGANDVDFINAQFGAVVLGFFNLDNTGTGLSTNTLTGAFWATAAAPLVAVLDLGDTEYQVNTNAIGLTAIDGTPQPLGVFEGLGGPEQVDLTVTVTPTPPTFTGLLGTTWLVTETGCAAAP